MSTILGYLIFVLTVSFIQQINCWQDCDVLKYEALNKTSDFGDLHVKIKRFNRTTHYFEGYFELKVNVSEDYFAEANAWHSSKGNNQWTQLPIKLARKSLKDIMNKEFRKSLMKDLHDVTNLPYSEDQNEDLLAMFTPKNYTVDHYVFNQSLLPKFLQDGWYKLYIYMYHLDNLVYGIYIEGKLY